MGNPFFPGTFVHLKYKLKQYFSVYLILSNTFDLIMNSQAKNSQLASTYHGSVVRLVI